MANLTELPIDILHHIFLYLDAVDFLSLTRISKAWFSYHEDPYFWRILTRTTFRTPSQPLLHADGARWKWLYKHLFTRTRLYTWGNHVYKDSSRGPISGRRGLTSSEPWPTRVDIGPEIGVIADVQCGGWSTTLLNSIGVIHTSGGYPGFPPEGSSLQTRLEFPQSYPATSAARYESSTAIKHFSQGRSFSLGLSDNGIVWEWKHHQALRVESSNVDIEKHRVTRVVAGWDRGSMYVDEVGILYWEPATSPSDMFGSEADARLFDSITIPGTGYHRSRSYENHGEFNSDLERRIGMVTNHVVLEGYIVFITDLNKIFFYRTTFPLTEDFRPDPVELASAYAELPSPVEIRDIQGSFRSFAIFTQCGSVLTASCSILDALHSQPPTNPLPRPAFTLLPQSRSIISIAFGDHHFHALHKNGTVSSYGSEPGRSGAFGLGGHWAILRGIHWRDWKLNIDEARTLWFEPLMSTWLFEMYEKGSFPSQPSPSFNLLKADRAGVRKAYGDYFEREGARWEEGVTAEGELGPYFVLKVSAAGWHSAALVLVDEEKAELVRRKQIVNAPQKHNKSPQPPRHLEPLLISWTSWLLNLLLRFARWFLGLTARDLAASIGSGGGGGSYQDSVAVVAGRQPHPLRHEATLPATNPPPNPPASLNEVEYKWTRQRFPELRMGIDEAGDGDGDGDGDVFLDEDESGEAAD